MKLRLRVAHVSVRKSRNAAGVEADVRDIVLNPDGEDAQTRAHFHGEPNVTMVMTGLRGDKFKGLGGGSLVTVEVEE